MAHSLRFRQVHLDFHTSEAIERIGARFDKEAFAGTLSKAHVDSVTLFAKCHHGWSYYPTEMGKVHPHLDFDLLSAQVEACKEADINTPIYISAGIDNAAARENPGWREIEHTGTYAGWVSDATAPGFHTMCFNTPYLAYLCAQIEEVVTRFPQADGIFLDIISQAQCCCPWCMALMEKNGWDAQKPEDRAKCADHVLMQYFERTTAAARVHDPSMPVFHNSGHITRGNRSILQYFSHLELESLPTGGWGYDHFPVSAKYVAKLPHDFLGMTGKFHTAWGEFGGFKHPNALRYECDAMIAMNAKCSVGDQLHPEGMLDDSTYDIIGTAFKDVAEKEPWCENAEPVADVAILSSEAVHGRKGNGTDADTGAARVLLQSHVLFDVVDPEMAFDGYKLLILPDNITLNATLKEKLDAYMAQGGALLLSGKSGLSQQGQQFLFDIGAEYKGESEFSPDYILPEKAFAPEFVHTPFIMYGSGQRIRASGGTSVGKVIDPYFNRTYRHFCSHQHAPNRPEASSFDCGVVKDSIMYLAHPVFTIYKKYGAVAYRQYIRNCIDHMLTGAKTIETNCPSQARVMLNHQPHMRRYVLHILYAPRELRGYFFDNPIEVIDEIPPLYDIDVSLSLPVSIQHAALQPQGAPVPLNFTNEHTLQLHLDVIQCHQMVELRY